MKSKLKGLMMSTLCFVMLILTTGCVNKEAITPEDFKTKMENKGYTIYDAKSQFSDYDYVQEAYIAVSSDSKYQIEFYELSDSNSAISFFNNNKNIFENSKASSASQTSVNMGNYSKYSLTTNGQFKVVSRIDNTVIYLNVPTTYKSTIKELLKGLGY